MAKKQGASFEFVGLTEMRNYFDHEVDRDIEEAKTSFASVVSAFATRVRAQVPVGPPKRGKHSPYVEGSLQASVEEYTNKSTNEVEGIVSVGAGTDYWMYAQADLAKEGRSWWHGQDEAEEIIDRVMNGETLD